MNITTGSFQIPGNNGTLHNNEVYLSERSPPHPTDDHTPFDQQAERAHFMMLSFSPSNEWIWTHPRGFPFNNTRVLPMCLRASDSPSKSRPGLNSAHVVSTNSPSGNACSVEGGCGATTTTAAGGGGGGGDSWPRILDPLFHLLSQKST